MTNIKAIGQFLPVSLFDVASSWGNGGDVRINHAALQALKMFDL
jgi:hypothetical protein